MIQLLVSRDEVSKQQKQITDCLRLTVGSRPPPPPYLNDSASLCGWSDSVLTCACPETGVLIAVITTDSSPSRRPLLQVTAETRLVGTMAIRPTNRAVTSGRYSLLLYSKTMARLLPMISASNSISNASERYFE